MLTKITLENFKVFKARTEIDFVKTNYAFLPENVADNDVLKGTVFVGANASGKSSVLEAMKLLLELLFGIPKQGANKQVSLLPWGAYLAPMELKFDFLISGKKISYYWKSHFQNNILDEQLYVDGHLVMKRENDSALSKIADREGISYDKSDVADCVLFLRTLYFNTKFQGHEVLQEWMRFLSRSLYLHQIDYDLNFSTEYNEANIYQYIKANGADEFNEFFEKHRINLSIELESIMEEYKPVLKFSRSVAHNTDERWHLPESMESTGNRSLIRLLHVFFLALSRPCMLIIDEFSSGLHNDLEELLLKYFMGHSSYSQIFLVTHSTNLLDNSILRPDQEYAVEFFEGKGSAVFRFSSEQPRLAQNVEKMYLNGVFGGLPNYRHSTDDED